MKVVKGIKRLIVILMLFASISGCVVLNAQYRHPVTAETKKCSSFGFGWLGVPLALAMHYDCKNDLEKKGFVKQ